MDSISMLQQAIWYMETHLLDNITYSDVARQLYVSDFHFHKMFSMVTGVTPNEYLRNRRLSQAAQELMTSDVKVIDLAFKYGYETPESFTKAFSRFHGVTPSLVKKRNKPLTLYNRLILKLSVEGGTMMQYRIEERAPFKVVAYVKAFPNTIVGEADNQDIANFWQELISSGRLNALKAHGNSSGFYGLCEALDKTSQTFNYGVGVATNLILLQRDYSYGMLSRRFGQCLSVLVVMAVALATHGTRFSKNFFPMHRTICLMMWTMSCIPSIVRRAFFAKFGFQ